MRLTATEAAKFGAQLEVQLLREDGRAKAISYVDTDAESVVVEGRDYPSSILAKALSIPEGKGIYVDESGDEVLPF